MTKKATSKKAASKKCAASAINMALLKRIGTLELQIDALKSTVDRIDTRVGVISDGFKFMADNCRQMFGLSGLSLVLDAITAKFK